ncbi:MAG: hypothetical protein DA328_00510 [Nitrososphaeraceae archaeon]|nr:hypothetical protein [Nitrososphaeraceae archaeon]
MNSFNKGWVKQVKNKNGASNIIKDSLKSQQPLKPKIEVAKNRIQTQNRKLEVMLDKLRNKEKYYFDQIVNSLQNHDSQQGKMLSTELAQVKKTTKTMSQLKLAMEQVHLRLESTVDVGDAMSALAPALGTLSNVKSRLSNVMPEFDIELDNMNNAFNEMLVDVSGIGNNNNSFMFNNTGDDVDKILAEASVIADQRTSLNFPDIPNNQYNRNRSSTGEHTL